LLIIILSAIIFFVLMLIITLLVKQVKFMPGFPPQSISMQEEKVQTEEEYIPVIQKNKKIPGLAKHELIHFLNKGSLYYMESPQDPEEIDPEKQELVPELEGEIAVTSKNILAVGENGIKKIPLGAIEKYCFRNAFLVIKRKNVKNKKDIFRVADKLAEFKYILLTLM